MFVLSMNKRVVAGTRYGIGDGWLIQAQQFLLHFVGAVGGVFSMCLVCIDVVYRVHISRLKCKSRIRFLQ